MDNKRIRKKQDYIYGNIYDFIADYKKVTDVKAIYDMHRYLMIKHNISP